MLLWGDDLCIHCVYTSSLGSPSFYNVMWHLLLREASALMSLVVVRVGDVSSCDGAGRK